MNSLHSSPSEREFRADETMIWILCKYGFFRTLFHLHQIIDARGPEFASLCSARFMFVLKKFISFALLPFRCVSRLVWGRRVRDVRWKFNASTGYGRWGYSITLPLHSASRSDVLLEIKKPFAVASPTLHCTAHCCVAIFFFILRFVELFFILIAKKCLQFVGFIVVYVFGLSGRGKKGEWHWPWQCMRRLIGAVCKWS